MYDFDIFGKIDISYQEKNQKYIRNIAILPLKLWVKGMYIVQLIQ